MKAVRIKLYQNMVNYRMELSYGYVQTYPLPTPSMIKGMAHAILDLDSYHNMKISVQGNYASVVTNMQKVYKFDRDRASRPNNPYNVIIGTSQKTATHGVMFVDEIVDMELLLHVSFDNDSLNDKLFEAVSQKTVVLGRNEDIARVDSEETKLVDVISLGNECRLEYSIYLKPEICKHEHIEGTFYRLPFYYEPVNSFNDKRIFRYVDAVYVARGNKIQDYPHLTTDSDGNPISFLSI
ncbi:MAG: CRISPR-associated protein Cas5 [Candidatus Loosdrechtia sp.]|uniref:CRISPR-associated protein Cas5 n=1 Tax=Candidatus Loosdrechtia sp. TaxID=3101272 RepID=UPI003A6DDC84|nr:MAG: CRISPR-associated protein Cas5 [Candidatus Jettenia sp. AMX2]